MTKGGDFKVAFVAGTLATGGAERQLVAMCRALTAAGVRTAVFSLTKGERYETVLGEAGTSVIWVGSSRIRLARIAAVASAVREFRPNIVQSVHGYTNVYAAAAARYCGVPSAGALRGSLGTFRKSHSLLAGALLRMPSAVITNSRSAWQDVVESKLLPPGRIFLVHNSLDVQPYRIATQAADRRGVRCIVVGRLTESKRVDRFLKALALARAKAPALTGMIVGDGPARASLERVSSSLGLKPYVTFTGLSHRVHDLLADAHMLVSCSEDEGMPNVILEAMAAGLPVVTTPAGDSRFLVEDGLSGHVVPFGDLLAMATRMVRLAHSCSLRIEMGARGRRVVERLFTIERLGADLLDVYRRLGAPGVPRYEATDAVRSVCLR